MKEKKKKNVYLGRIRKLLETMLSSKNLTKETKTRATAFAISSGRFLKLTREEFRKLSKRQKLMMHEPWHSRDDSDKLDVSRKEGGGGPTSIEDCFDASIQGLKNK